MLVHESTGPLADIDAAFFARKSMELAAVASLRELAVNKLNQDLSSSHILLSLVCAAMAAFDLSPFTLPLPELQALVDTLAQLYEGTRCMHAVTSGTCFILLCNWEWFIAQFTTTNFLMFMQRLDFTIAE